MNHRRSTSSVLLLLFQLDRFWDPSLLQPSLEKKLQPTRTSGTPLFLIGTTSPLRNPNLLGLVPNCMNRWSKSNVICTSGPFVGNFQRRSSILFVVILKVSILMTMNMAGEGCTQVSKMMKIWKIKKNRESYVYCIVVRTGLRTSGSCWRRLRP